MSEEYKFTFSLTVPEINCLIETLQQKALESRSMEWSGLAGKLQSGFLVTRRMLVDDYGCDPKEVKSLTDPDKVTKQGWGEGAMHLFA